MTRSDRANPYWMLTPLGLFVVAVVVAEAALGTTGMGASGKPLAVTLMAALFAGSISAFLLLPRAPAHVRLALFATAGVSVVALHVVDPYGPVIGLFLVAAFAPLTEPRRVATGLLIAVVVAFNVVQLVNSGETIVLTVATDAGAAFFYLFGYLLQREKTQRERLSQLLVELEVSRAAERESSRLAQRAEIARDLHDVLAHSMSGLVMQLSAARLLAETTQADPELVMILERANSLARSGLDEARGAVGTLRGEEPPGMAQLQQLLDHHRTATSADVTLHVEGTPVALSPEADATVYRALQEALSNVRKHGSAGTCEVHVQWQPDLLTVTVTNPAPGDATAARGYGLQGMEERVRKLGGHTTHTRTAHGFALTIVVPLVLRDSPATPGAAFSAPGEDAQRRTTVGRPQPQSGGPR